MAGFRRGGGDGGGEAEAAAVVAPAEGQVAVGGGQALGDAAQAAAGGADSGPVLGWAGEAAAVVGDLEGHLAWALGEPEPAVPGAGMPDHVGDGLTQAPGQDRLGVRVERARPHGQLRVVLQADAGRLEGAARRDDLDREGGPAVAADRLPDVVQSLPADLADVAELGEDRVALG